MKKFTHHIHELSTLIGHEPGDEPPTEDHARRMVELIEDEIGKKVTPDLLLGLAQYCEEQAGWYRRLAQERALSH